MKKSTTLLPLSLVLLFGTSHAFASDSSVLADDEGSSSAGTSTPTAVEFDPRDRNKDGKVSLGEKVFDALDCNDDGKLNLKDIAHLPGHLLGKLKGIFDANGDGELEFAEIILGTQEALVRLDTLTGRVLLLSDTIQKSTYFSLIPENVQGSLTALFALVDKAAQDTKDGLNIGQSYVKNIEGALTDLKPLVADLFKGLGDKVTSEEKLQLKKDVFAYLEMVKGWDSTGDNTKLVTSVEKRLAKA